MKKSFTYSLLKKIILRVSLVSIVMLIISGLFITFGFIDDIKDDFGVFGSDALIDIFLSEAFEHVYLIFILSFVILIIFIYFTVKNSLKDINQIADKVKKIDINDATILDLDISTPKEIEPLISAIKESFQRIKNDIKQQKEFIQNASHELNTPIAILRANIEGLSETSVKEDLLNDLSLLENVATQLLRLSQVENFKIKHNETTDIIKTVNLVIENFEKDKERINLIINTSDGVINGNKEYLYMCFRNLLENALYNSPYNSKIIITINQDNEIFFQNEKANKDLKQEDVGNIFKKFLRLEKNKYNGSGLGLTIVKRIIEAHNASLSVDIDDKNFKISLKFKPQI